MTLLQAAKAWALLRLPVLHYLRADTPEEFTEEAPRKQGRESLMQYACLIQGPPLPANNQPAHSDGDSEDSSDDADEQEHHEEAAGPAPLDMPGGSDPDLAEAALVGRPCLTYHNCLPHASAGMHSPLKALLMNTALLAGLMPTCILRRMYTQRSQLYKGPVLTELQVYSTATVP